MGRSLIIVVAGLIAVFSVIQMNMQEKQVMALDRSFNYYRSQQARDIANSLVEQALQEIRADMAWRTGITAANFLGGSGQVQVFDMMSDSTVGRYELRILGTGQVDSTVSNVEVYMRRTSFSKYSYFTNVEPDIYFISGDTIEGPAHTNGPFHMYGEPVFTGKVTSPQMWQGWGNPRFLNGSNFNAGYIALPNDLTELHDAANAGGLLLDQTSKLEFHDDGTIDISHWIGNHYYGYWSSPDEYDLSDFNGVISSSQNIYVKGEVNGQVTVHSSSDIKIIGDITYADDPISNPASDDMLGIVSEGQVIVDDHAHEDHGSQDLTIDASIMALGNSFTVEDYGDGGPRGRLYILGGVIQETRGAVGTFGRYGNQSYLRSGFQKSYSYDERLMTRWPPYYPVRDSYSIISWKE